MSINAKMQFFRSCLAVAVIQFMVFVLASCGDAPGQVNAVVVCSIRKVGDDYLFPLQEIIVNKTNLNLNLHEGQDMRGRGLRYRGHSDRVFPNMIIVSYSIKKDKKSGNLTFQVVETLSVINGKIPALNNQSLSDYIREIQQKL